MKVHPLIKWGLIVTILLFSLFGAAFVGLLAYVVHTQHAYASMPDTHDLKGQIQKMGQDYLHGHKNAALVIAFYQHGKESVQGFGKISDSNQNPPDARTIYEIGSVTKIFTATLLSEMLDDGVAKPNDPISLFLPKDVTSPTLNGHEITLMNLATHTSGLPRIPDNLLPTAKNMSDPYVNYSTRDLYQSLKTVKLKSEPGAKSAYSNYGYGLLGKLMEIKTGKGYEELIQENICVPLALDSTTTQLSKDQSARLTPGHSPDGKVVSNWHFDALAGCGAIRSDATDLLKFIEANLGPANSRISRAFENMQKCYFKGFTGKVGLGWQITGTLQGLTVIWHNGGTGGYRSFVGFDKANQTGVVILSNYGDAFAGDSSVDKMGMKLLTIGSKVSLE